jgi:hypothetical protein
MLLVLCVWQLETSCMSSVVQTNDLTGNPLSGFGPMEDAREVSLMLRAWIWRKFHLSPARPLLSLCATHFPATHLSGNALVPLWGPLSAPITKHKKRVDKIGSMRSSRAQRCVFLGTAVRQFGDVCWDQQCSQAGNPFFKKGKLQVPCSQTQQKLFISGALQQSDTCIWSARTTAAVLSMSDSARPKFKFKLLAEVAAVLASASHHRPCRCLQLPIAGSLTTQQMLMTCGRPYCVSLSQPVGTVAIPPRYHADVPRAQYLVATVTDHAFMHPCYHPHATPHTA